MDGDIEPGVIDDIARRGHAHVGREDPRPRFLTTAIDPVRSGLEMAGHGGEVLVGFAIGRCSCPPGRKSSWKGAPVKACSTFARM